MELMVYITVPDQSLARQLAEILVQEKLAAGVNIAGPVESIFRFEGKMKKATEWQLFAQVFEGDFNRLKEVVIAKHPYKVPCIVGWNLDRGHVPFLEWIENRGEL